MQTIKPIQIIFAVLALGALGILLRSYSHKKESTDSKNVPAQLNLQKNNNLKLPSQFNPQFFIDRWNIKNKLASGGSAGLPDEQEREKQRQQLLFDAAYQVFSICKDYQDADDYIKRGSQVSKSDCIGYPEVAVMVGPEQLPQLYNMLQDPEYAPYYHNIVQMIGYTGHDEKSADVLWDFFQRDADYWTENSSPNNKHAKILSLSLIGINGSEKYDPMLRKAATAEGALELAANWINSPYLYKKMGFYSPDDVIRRIQFLAFEGLIYTQRPENIEIVRQMYQKEYDLVKNTNNITPLFGALVDSMAYQDFVANNSLEFLLIMQSSQSQTIFMKIIRPYLDKYGWYPFKQ